MSDDAIRVFLRQDKKTTIEVNEADAVTNTSLSRQTPPMRVMTIVGSSIGVYVVLKNNDVRMRFDEAHELAINILKTMGITSGYRKHYNGGGMVCYTARKFRNIEDTTK